jgi:hypothetical protein
MADLVRVLVPRSTRQNFITPPRVGVCVGKLTDKLVVGGVVGDGNDTGLLGDTLRAPGEVTGVETETTELAVATTGADNVNT